MALVSTKSADYTNLGYNTVTGQPTAAYLAHATLFPKKGHLVVIDPALPDCYDLAADGEVPVGHLTAVSPDKTVLTVVLWVAGVTVILERTGAIALGQSVQATATPMGTIIPRGTVKTAAPGAGRGIVIANDPRGTGTTEVLITGGNA